MTAFSLTLASILSPSPGLSNSQTHANSGKLRPTRPLVGSTPRAGGAHAPAAKPTARAGVLTPPPVENYAHLPLGFERNDGQADAEVEFLARGRGYELFLTAGAARLMLNRRAHASTTHQGRAFDGLAARELPVALTQNLHRAPWNLDMGLPAVNTLYDPLGKNQNSSQEDLDAQNPQSAPTEVVDLRLVGANQKAELRGGDELPGKSNYYIGRDSTKWRTDIPNFARVKYQGIYPGIDLVYYGDPSGQLEYDFVIGPGADASVIALDVAAGLPRHPSEENGGVKPPLQIASDGDLVIKTANGDLRFHKPVIYQLGTEAEQLTTGHVRRTAVDGEYVLRGGNQVGFKLGSYDHTRPLIIDPVLVYSTLVADIDIGTGSGTAGAIGVDSSGNAYVVGYGYTGDSSGFYLVGINAQGTAYLYSTYLAAGASSIDNPVSIAVDSAGNSYITASCPDGLSTTSGAPFPISNAYDVGPFAAKFSATGKLIYATYLSGVDGFSEAIAIDSTGAAYTTGSTSVGFPTVNAFESQAQQGAAGFVQKLDPTGTTIIYSTYLNGGSGTGIAVDAAGSAYVVGGAGIGFPVKNALEPSVVASFGNIFLTKFTPDGTGLVYSTYLGGSGGYSNSSGNLEDTASAVAVDGAGNAYVTGTLGSWDFPFTMNAYRVSCTESAVEACQSPGLFVLKVAPNDAALIYSTYLGTGTSWGLALDSAGQVWVTGNTPSGAFPVLQGIEAGYQGVAVPTEFGYTPQNPFVTRLDANGLPNFSTYLSASFGTLMFTPVKVAVDGSGNAYVAGSVQNQYDFPLVNPLKSYVFSSAFAAKINPSAHGPVLSVAPLVMPIVTVRNVGDQTLTLSNLAVGSGNVLQGGTCGTSLAAGASCNLVVADKNPAPGLPPGTLTITSNAPGSPQTFSLQQPPLNPNSQFIISPPLVDFPAQLDGTSGNAKTITVTNLDYPTSVNITLPAISAGTQSSQLSADFSQTNNCPTTLPAGQSCTVTVQYQPSGGTNGFEWGGVSINNNYDISGPTTIGLLGAGSPDALLASAGTSQLGASYTVIQFGTLTVGATTLPRVVSLTNVSTQPVTVSGVTVTGPFAQTNNCSALAPQTSCRVSISFVPTANGPVTGTVKVASGGQGSPTVISVAGTGFVPSDLDVSPASAQFGNVLVGTTGSVPLTLTNLSSTTMQLSSFVVAPSQFSQTNTCGGSLGPGATCTVTVSASPTGAESLNGTLTIVHSGNGSPQVIALTGTEATALVLSPAQDLSFGPQDVGVVSPPQPVALSNIGATPVTISSVSVSGDFEVVDNSCGTTLAANANCTLQISFNPSVAGGANGTLKIIASDFRQTHFISLFGNGVSLPAASLSAKSLSFPALFVSSTSAAQTINVSNSGGASLQINGINISGPFAQANTCATAIAINSTCSISVTFTPTAGGPQTGTIVIADNANDSPQSIALSGAGQDFSLAGAAGSSFPTSVTQGHSAVFNLSIAPLGGLTGSVSFTCNGAPSEATCTVSPSPAVMSASGPTPVTVTVTTTASSNIGFNRQPPSPPWRWFLILTLLMAAGVTAVSLRRWPWRQSALLLAATLALLILVSCGGGGGGGGPVTPPSNTGTPKGAYTLTIIGTFTSGSSIVQHQMSLPLIVD